MAPSSTAMPPPTSRIALLPPPPVVGVTTTHTHTHTHTYTYTYTRTPRLCSLVFYYVSELLAPLLIPALSHAPELPVFFWHLQSIQYQVQLLGASYRASRALYSSILHVPRPCSHVSSVLGFIGSVCNICRHLTPSWKRGLFIDHARVVSVAQIWGDWIFKELKT